MPQRLRIHIPEPCHEDWNAMTPADKGRHCASCNKVVMDFTAMSDAQIIAYFQSAKENTCGRFYNHQLNRDFYLYTTTAGKRKRIKYIAVSMFVAQLFAYRSYAKVDMVDTVMVKIDSCATAELDTCAVNIDTSKYTWQPDTAKPTKDCSVYVVTVSETYGYTVVSGNATPTNIDELPNLILSPWDNYLGKGYRFLQQVLPAYFLFRQNNGALAYTNRKESIIETRAAPLIPSKPKPSKPKQVLKWLATLPKRLRTGDSEIEA